MGKLSIDWLKYCPNVKCVIKFGKWSIGWLKLFPNVKCIIDFGKLSIGWLKPSPRVKYVIEFGRLSIGFLNSSPKSILWTLHNILKSVILHLLKFNDKFLLEFLIRVCNLFLKSISV